MDVELRDLLLHVGLLPLYLFLGTARHEWSHAIFARLEGVIVRRVVFWPHWFRSWQDPTTLDFLYRISYSPKRGYHFHFGTWIWGDGKDPNMSTHLAPYITGVLLAIFGDVLMPLIELHNEMHGVLAAIIIFLVSPALDLLYNVAKWLLFKRGDWEKAFSHGRD